MEGLQITTVRKNVYVLKFGQKIRIQLSTRPKLRLCAAAEFHFRSWVQPAISFTETNLNDPFILFTLNK